jgi:hypothetical protein
MRTKVSEELQSLREQVERLASCRGHSWSWIRTASEERLKDYIANPVFPSWWSLGIGRMGETSGPG